MTYYGPGSGVAIALNEAHCQLFGPKAANIGVVGLGTGTLACLSPSRASAGRFFEIDPAVLEYVTAMAPFTFLDPGARRTHPQIVLGDARLQLENAPARLHSTCSVIDAFSSDAIPLHLLTEEALGIYHARACPPRAGLLIFHISNRYIDLRTRDRRFGKTGIGASPPDDPQRQSGKTGSI